MSSYQDVLIVNLWMKKIFRVIWVISLKTKERFVEKNWILIFYQLRRVLLIKYFLKTFRKKKIKFFKNLSRIKFFKKIRKNLSHTLLLPRIFISHYLFLKLIIKLTSRVEYIKSIILQLLKRWKRDPKKTRRRVKWHTMHTAKEWDFKMSYMSFFNQKFSSRCRSLLYVCT